MFVTKVLPIACVSLMLAALFGCATEQSRDDLKQYSDAPSGQPSAEIVAVRSAQEEADAWAIAKSSKDAEVLNIYLDRFPQGGHAAMAKLRLKLIQSGEL